MDHFLTAAWQAAQMAGALIRENWQRAHAVEYKSAIDLVTATDRASEETIVAHLAKRYPGHSILAEEATAIVAPGSVYRWIVDPLDGTTNFAHSFPHFAVSIALEREKEIILGLIYDPLRDEGFSALAGQGALLNDKPIRVSKTAELDKSLLATGFPYDHREDPDYYLKYFRSFTRQAQGIRRAGSAALDLCYVAAGRLDGFWELKLKPWDIAAGALIVSEAGGVMSNFSGGKFSIDGDETLASNGLIHDEMIRALEEAEE
ncbi:MAG TPA: inositol monophosphatase family protein [Verrucomicrobiae bacterium]|jgi:myo-inositol-1(or 4)-monophosphatase|nr:inositol monophosphatase family protein [Verrucomicrobiae bacterium]